MIKEHLIATFKKNALKTYDVAAFLLADSFIYVMMVTAIFLPRFVLNFYFSHSGSEGKVDAIILQWLGFIGHIGFFIVYLTLLAKDVRIFIKKDYENI